MSVHVLLCDSATAVGLTLFPICILEKKGLMNTVITMTSTIVFALRFLHISFSQSAT